ncbi:hypothetical protein J4Q44_G00375300 [Coregonus suidteri]|uniref:C2H2-type domain-containing protein n=1 Tax=Coregonus suidteri TaxID=861788 RepID=A0AAN8KSV4_9TELE
MEQPRSPGEKTYLPTTPASKGLEEEVCRMCGCTFDAIRKKNDLLLGKYYSMKPAYTFTLEELMGPVTIGDNLMSVCSNCKGLLSQYRRCNADAQRIAGLVKNMTRENTVGCKRCTTSTEKSPERKKPHSVTSVVPRQIGSAGRNLFQSDSVSVPSSTPTTVTAPTTPTPLMWSPETVKGEVGRLTLSNPESQTQPSTNLAATRSTCPATRRYGINTFKKETKVVVRTAKSMKSRILKGPFEKIGTNLAQGRYRALPRCVMSVPGLRDVTVDEVLSVVEKECRNLTSLRFNSILQRIDPDDVKSFKWEKVLAEWRENAPTFLKFLECVSTFSEVNTSQMATQRGKGQMCAVAMAGVTLLRARSNKMSAPMDFPPDSLQLSLSVFEEEVPPEQQHCEQEWSPSLGQEDPEPTQIKEEQEELRTSQEEEQLQGLEADTIEFIFTPCVKSECDQEDPLQSLTLPQTQTVENRESDSKPVDLKPFGTVTFSKKRLSECRFCKKCYNSTYKLKTHVRLCHGGKPCTCPVCGKTFKLKKDLSRHMSIHTGEKRFSCGDCGKCFSQKGVLEKHILTHTGEKPFSCGDCGKSFNRKEHLTRHVLTHTGEKPFRCDCGKSFSLKNNLTMHKLTHTGEKPFSCGDCGKCFTRKHTLTYHKQTHTGEKPFSCGDCGKGFSLKNNLTNHIRTHTGEKPFSCGDCGKSFNHKAHLTRHTLTHTGEKPFSCGDCGKCFSRKQRLTEHIRTHTGEKPFRCGDCGKSFSLKQSLTEHIRTHTGEKPFSCCDCGKSFRLKKSLTEHIRTHTGENPFSCGDCGKSFTQKTNLLTHVKNVHKGRKQDEN